MIRPFATASRHQQIQNEWEAHEGGAIISIPEVFNIWNIGQNK